MARRPKPHVHGRDHEHGGADTTLIHYEDVGTSGGGTGGGIQFDTYPQSGGWLYAETTDTGGGPESYGIELTDLTGNGIALKSIPIYLGDIDGDLANGLKIVITGSGIRITLTGSQTLQVRDETGAPIFQVDQNGDLHGKTGKALTFDL